MGKESRLNPIAQANAVPQQRIEYLKLGDGYGLLGVGLQPVLDTEGNLHILLMATCARVSDLVPINKIVKVALGEPAKISTKDLIAKIAEAMDGHAEKPLRPE